MPRARSPNRDKAFQLWIESHGRSRFAPGNTPTNGTRKLKKSRCQMGKATLSNASKAASAVIEMLSAIMAARRLVIKTTFGTARMSESWLA